VEQAEGELRSRKKSAVKKLRGRFKELADKEGLTVAEVVGIRRKRKAVGERAPVEPKYQNPKNLAETWSGRGRKPKWLEVALKKSGVKVEQFAIKGPTVRTNLTAPTSAGH